MKILFLPATMLMGRLRFAGKFLIVGFVFLGVLAAFIADHVRDATNRLGHIAAQRSAAAFISDLVVWNKVLIEYRGIAILAPVGDAGVRDRLARKAEEVERSLGRLEADAGNFLAHFDTRKGAADIRAGWEALKKTVAQLPLDKDFAQKAFAAHGKEFDRLYAFIRDLGDLSGVASEPEMDVFYLGFPLANATPKLAGITVRFLAYETLNIARGSLTPKDKVFYEVTDVRLADAYSQVESMFGQAFKADPALKSRLAPPLEAAKAAGRKFVEFTRKSFIASESIGVGPEEVQAAAMPAIDAAWALVDANIREFDAVLVNKSADTRAALARTGMLAAVAFLLSLYLYVGMAISVRTATAKLSAMTGRIAAGDLGESVEVRTRDELADIGGGLNAMSASLRSLVGEMRDTATALVAACSHVNAATGAISAGTLEQVESTQATAAAVEQISVTLNQVADDLKDAVDSSSDVAAAAEQGRADMVELQQQSGRAAQAVDAASVQVDQLGAVTSRIGGIAETIRGIADKTNLLALNASIEAARAGEHGRGFAVVADEVRKLAENTRSATDEIETMVASVQTEVQGVVGQMSESRNLVARGAELTGSAVGMLDLIRDKIEGNRAKIEAISAASAEQRGASHAIGQSVERIARQTETTDAAIRDIGSVAHRLGDLAAQLESGIGRFRIPA